MYKVIVETKEGNRCQMGEYKQQARAENLAAHYFYNPGEFPTLKRAWVECEGKTIKEYKEEVRP